MSREKYNTNQSALVLDAIKSVEGNFEIKQIEELLKDKVGPATIYRQIKKLCEEKSVRKELVGDNAYYCYIGDCDNDEHFNLLCRKCGTIKHIECDCLDKFSKSIKKEYNFEIDSDQLIIQGLCNECKNAQN